MRISHWCVGVVCAVICAMALAEGPEDAAKAAALEWLAALDKGQYELAWEEAAPLVKRQIESEQWTKAVSGVRESFGPLRSRSVKTAIYRKDLPGAPTGDYVVMQFDSVFEHKESAVETVTFMLADGQWKMAGYFMR